MGGQALYLVAAGRGESPPVFCAPRGPGADDVRPGTLRPEGRARGFGYTEFIVKPGTPEVYRLPYSETVEISAFVPKGLVRMYVGDCLVPIAVDPQNNHVSRYPWDMSAYLTFEADEETEVYVKVEPFTEKGE